MSFDIQVSMIRTYNFMNGIDSNFLTENVFGSNPDRQKKLLQESREQTVFNV